MNGIGAAYLLFQYRNWFFHSDHSFHRLISCSFSFNRFFHSIDGLYRTFPLRGENLDIPNCEWCLCLCLGFLGSTFAWYSSAIHSSPRFLQSNGDFVICSGSMSLSDSGGFRTSFGTTAALRNLDLPDFPFIIFLSFSLSDSSLLASCKEHKVIGVY